MAINAIMSVAGLSLDGRERAFLREADPWGIILFGRNVQSPDQLRALTGEIRAALGRDAPILVDQEGGRVQRLTAPQWRQWLPPLDQVQAALPLASAASVPAANAPPTGARAPEWSQSPDAPLTAPLSLIDPAELARAERIFWLRSALIAAELRAVGIDTNCAPGADVAHENTHPFLRNRCLSDDPALVARLARAIAEGLLAGGCLPVMKHMPGHGASTLDTHFELPRVNDDRDTLRTRDFAPFKALNDLPMAMTGHLVFPAFDDAAPATQSAQMIDVIRREIGFDGLLMTDDIGMQALKGPVSERARASLAAGCDLVLHCNGVLSDSEQVAAVCQTLSGEAERRAQNALALRPTAGQVDVKALDAEFAELTGAT